MFSPAPSQIAKCPRHARPQSSVLIVEQSKQLLKFLVRYDSRVSDDVHDHVCGTTVGMVQDLEEIGSQVMEYASNDKACPGSNVVVIVAKHFKEVLADRIRAEQQRLQFEKEGFKPVVSCDSAVQFGSNLCRCGPGAYEPILGTNSQDWVKVVTEPI